MSIKAHVELQHLTSLSASEKEREASMGDRGDTVFDSAPHELYATIPEARREHTRYHADQIRDPEARTTESTLATCPSEGDESRGKLVGGKGRGRLECKNKMYEDHDVKVKEEYHHPTLTASTRKAYSESVGKEYREPQNSWVTCHCRFQYLLGAFFIIMAILLAVASLSLSLLLWFGVYGGSECSCPDQTSFKALTLELDIIEEKNRALRLYLEELQNSTVTEGDLSAGVSSIHFAILQLNSTARTLGKRETTFTITNMSIYDNCTSITASTCTISGGGIDDCVSIFNDLHEPDKYLLSMYCRFFDTSGEQNSLDSEIVFNKDGRVACRCYRLIQEGFARSPDLGCELITTTCPSQQSITGKLEVS